MKREHAPFYGCPLPFPTEPDGRWKLRCKVLDAADGDTFTIIIDRGFFDTSTRDNRLASIDVYERYTGTPDHRELGRQAWLDVLANVVGTYAYIYTRLDPEKYGRVLGDLEYMDDTGTMRELTLELRAAGYEKPAGG